MGLRFRRSIRIFPGVRLNFSRSGISTSVGVRGAHVTMGKNGTRTTVGLPGTGLSYSEVTPKHPAGRSAGYHWMAILVAAMVLLAFCWLVWNR